MCSHVYTYYTHTYTHYINKYVNTIKTILKWQAWDLNSWGIEVYLPLRKQVAVIV